MSNQWKKIKNSLSMICIIIDISFSLVLLYDKRLEIGSYLAPQLIPQFSCSDQRGNKHGYAAACFHIDLYTFG
jgi:hypothetical protein